MATQVHFLGAGDAFSAGGRHQAGYLVRGTSGTVLLDCGATTLTSMRRDGLDPSAIDAIVLSHLHGDHFAGLPYLFLEYVHQQRRSRLLRIAGPPGTQDRVNALYRAMYGELAQRQLPFPIEFIELKPGVPMEEIGGVAVEPFRVPHQEHELSLALRVQIDGRTLLYSGDTGWTEGLVEWAQDTDLFICECCFYDTRVGYHLDYPRLADNHHRFGTRRMILTHLGREVLARRADLALEIADDGLVVGV